MYFIKIYEKSKISIYFLMVILIGIYSNNYANNKIVGTIDTTMPKEIPIEIINDWQESDSIGDSYKSAIEKIVQNLPAAYKEKIVPGISKEAYIAACHLRRIARIAPYTAQIKKIILARHHDLGGPIIGFLEEMNSDGFISCMGKWGGISCESKPATYEPGGALCIVKFENYYPTITTLLEDTLGVIKDPCVSFNMEKAVFAWSKDNNGYHLWEIEINNPENVRQLTNDPDGLNVSDYEPCYLQNGDILFNSSRCFGFVETYNNMTSNLFIINKDGRFLRRISYDQVHTFHPVVMDDGKILYSRWEYNDRNAKSCLGLFSMNPDGCQQNEHFGNQTGWPSTFIQARQIPGSQKIISVISEYSAPYAGDLVIIDPNQARNGLSAIQLIAPRRPNPIISFAGYDSCMKEYNFQNPYPFDEDWFLVSWRKNAHDKFKIYFMSSSGEHELIAWDAHQSLSQPISLVDRISCAVPSIPTYQTDYRTDKSSVSVHDVYFGYGTGDKVPKGSIEKIRVIALEYRTDPAFGNTGSSSFQMTPVGRWNCSWEAKRIIGEVNVGADGSASFYVPPKTPLYLQLIDSKGRMVQTMRSWMTLQPGEEFVCLGCHEDKNIAPSANVSSSGKNPIQLDRFYDIDETGYFSYPQHIQPILNENCVKTGCHDDSHPVLNLQGDKVWTGTLDPDNRNAFRYWNRSYINLTDPSKNYVNYIDINTTAEGLQPNSVGSQKSKVLNMMLEGHHDVSLSDEAFEKLAAWIDLCIPHSGTYTDDMRDEDAAKYLKRLERRKRHEELEAKNIEEFVASGGYEAYINSSSSNRSDYNPSIKSSVTTPHQFNVAVDHVTKKMTFHLPMEGNIAIVDLKGRQINKVEITAEEFSKNRKYTITINLPAGIYLVKFSNRLMRQEKICSVL